MATSTKWRINVTANNGYAGNLGISEIQMRTAVGVPLLFSGGTPSASTEETFGPGTYAADKAADNNTNTNWYTINGTNTGWWQYEFASTIDVAAYVIASVDFDDTTAPKDFTLEYWDGAAWQVADTQTSQTGWEPSGFEIREYTVGTPGYTTLPDMMYSGAATIDGNISLPTLTLSGSAFLDVEVVLSLFSLDGASEVTFAVQPANGDATLPNMMLAGSLEAALRLPALTVSASGFSGTVSIGSVNFSQLELSGSLEGPLALPVMAVAASGLTGEVLNGASVMPSTTVSGESLTGMLGIGDAVLPRWLVAGDSGAGGDIAILELGINASGLSGAIGSAAILLSKLELSGSLRQEGDGDGNVAFSALTLDAAATSTAVIAGAVTLDGIAVDGTAFAGNTASASLTLPLWSVAADGHSSEIGTATVTLPMLALDGVLVSTVTAPVFTGVVLNTRTNAVTTYSGGAFNSLCNFNGLVLAASSTGIVALTGDTDQGAQIDAVLTSGVSDFQSDKIKRVIAGYVGYRAAGDMELTLITDEHHEYIYRIEPRQTAIHPGKVKFGRGCDGLYWQWRLANRSGADFSLDSLRLDAEVLSRRV